MECQAGDLDTMADHTTTLPTLIDTSGRARGGQFLYGLESLWLPVPCCRPTRRSGLAMRCSPPLGTGKAGQRGIEEGGAFVRSHTAEKLA